MNLKTGGNVGFRSGGIPPSTGNYKSIINIKL